jgi:c-di-GMP-binding flagellar brake protein YcgR
MLHHGKVGFERRAFPRLHVELPIVYHPADRGPKSATAQNVSQGGLMLLLEDAVSAGDRLRVQMHLTDKKGARIVEAVGRVVWVSLKAEGEGAGYKVGFAFEEIDPAHLKTLAAFEAIWLEQGRK